MTVVADICGEDNHRSLQWLALAKSRRFIMLYWVVLHHRTSSYWDNIYIQLESIKEIKPIIHLTSPTLHMDLGALLEGNLKTSCCSPWRLWGMPLRPWSGFKQPTAPTARAWKWHIHWVTNSHCLVKGTLKQIVMDPRAEWHKVASIGHGLDNLWDCGARQVPLMFGLGSLCATEVPGPK